MTHKYIAANMAATSHALAFDTPSTHGAFRLSTTSSLSVGLVITRFGVVWKVI